MLYRDYVKRPMDFVISLIAFAALSPVLLLVAVAVKVKLGSPVIFKQERPGRNERIFTIYKFRTMKEGRGENGEQLPDSVRLTEFGRFLRSTSLDELPELWNIIRGDMAIVGPRPLAVEYLPYYNEVERRRHEVRPGLTGLAQVNGRNVTTWEQRFAYDVEYVDRISFALDMMIIFKTMMMAVKRSDIGERGKDAPPDFHRLRRREEIEREVP